MNILVGGAGANVTLSAPVSTDNCAVTGVSFVPASGSFFGLGVTNVTATVTDAAGNTATCAFTVTVTAMVSPPQAPGYLIVEGQDTKTLKLRFPDAASDEDGYEIFRSRDGQTWSLHVLTGAYNTVAEIVYYDSINTEADEIYYYIVRTKRGSSRSGFTNSAHDHTYPHAPNVSVMMPACENGEGKFKATGTHASNKYRWYKDAVITTPFTDGNGNPFDADVFVTEKLTSARTYYVTAKGKKYESKPRVAVVMPVISRPHINIVGGFAQRACGGEITLAVEPIAGATYLWSRDGFTIAGASGNTFTATQSGIYHVIVNNGSCNTVSAPIAVTVNYKPKAIINEGNSVSFCASGIISAKAEPTVAYEWYKDGVFVASGVSLVVSETGTYTLKAIEYGCENTAEIKVNVASFPANISISADNETLCAGANVVLTTSAFAGVSYRWYRDGRLFATTTLPTVTARRGGEYKVALSYNEFCSRLSTSSVFVNEIKPVRLSQTFDGVTLTVNVPDGASVASATWTIDGEPAPSLNGQLTFKPTRNGVYELTVVWDNGCESSMRTNIILGTLGTDDDEDVSQEMNLLVYPNPTREKLFVSFGTTPKTSVSVVMTDNLGRTMLQFEEKVLGEKLEIKTGDLPRGAYFLTVRFDGTEKTVKIVKE
jgi:hypothetical protein